jgi:Ni,Fe-hydrogenase III small subunit
VANVIPVDVTVPGCPPPPLEIMRGILAAVRRGRGAVPTQS